jgi:hypothetical protein
LATEKTHYASIKKIVATRVHHDAKLNGNGSTNVSEGRWLRLYDWKERHALVHHHLAIGHFAPLNLWQ